MWLRIIFIIFIFITYIWHTSAKWIDTQYKKQIVIFFNNFEIKNKKLSTRVIKLTQLTQKLDKLDYKDNTKINYLTKILHYKINKYKESIKQNNSRRIAHAWWLYNWETYTNSLNALETNKNKYNLFEIDFSWTSDEKLVCIHDWEWSFKKSFNLKNIKNIPSYEEFTSYVNWNSKYKNCTLDSLINWLHNNPNKYIITDIKSNNLKWLNYIINNYPSYRNQFIPQIYDPINYSFVEKLWYKKIIWTLYKYWENDSTVVFYSKKMKKNLYAITMPIHRVENGLSKKLNIFTYTHTINTVSDLDRILKLWINDIYTDKLYR